jgi:TolB-like protein/DNA-binding winged helix-turn-helix (wHTH) protein/Tfp pilus assembly protein PilF
MASAKLCFWDYELDPDGFELCRAGHRIRLERKPMELLILLAEKRGHLVGREEIIDKIWGKDFFFDAENGINNAVRKIRSALNDDAERPRFVETAIGKGYRFIAPVEPILGPLGSPPAAPAVSRRGPRWFHWRRIWVPAVAVAALFAGVLVFNAAGIRGRIFGLGLSPIHSIAVLPLENLSGDPTQEYFADGMTEALTTELAQIRALKVISRTSVMQYKGTKKLLPQIAQELGVDAVVEGAVQRSGDRVGITVQMIHAPSDRHLLARSYERGLGDILALQREIAQAIAIEIKAKLTPPEKVHFASAPSIDSEAYQSYLKGRFLLDEGQTKKAIAYFQGAIQKDPNYALAYAGLANSYITLGLPWSADSPPKEVLPQAKAAARRALEIDDSLGEAHLALARTIQLYDWDWPAVEKEYQRALKLNPNDAMAHAEYSEYLQGMARNEEALVQLRQAMALDPLDSGPVARLGDVFYLARQYDQGVRAFQRALELEPDNIDAHVGLGWVYAEKKMYREAIVELEKAVNLSNRHELVVASLGKVLGDSGRKQEARKLLEELEERSTHRYISPCTIALVQIGLRERDQAIASLEQGYINRDPWLLCVRVNPLMDDLRSDSRFQDLVRRVIGN